MPSHQRVYLVAQERQDEVSNWLCVQVMLIQLQALQHHPGKMNESWNHMKKKRKCLSSQKNNNCCTIIQTSYNFTTWFGMMFHVEFIHLFFLPLLAFLLISLEKVVLVEPLILCRFCFIFWYCCVSGFLFEVRRS